ncbi:hypothetical protein CL614_09490 [archaeon]|nr:hypothetical protein [archaeon]|tara:strand:+ start:343 stop:624 length:282 start_codon:yes stop_codon:yes gene_type:complete
MYTSNSTISIGFPEIAMISSVVLYVYGQSALGHVFLGLSLLLGFGRLAYLMHKFNETQKNLGTQQQDVKDAIFKAATAFASTTNKKNNRHNLN